MTRTNERRNDAYSCTRSQNFSADKCVNMYVLGTTMHKMLQIPIQSAKRNTVKITHTCTHESVERRAVQRTALAATTRVGSFCEYFVHS